MPPSRRQTDKTATVIVVANRKKVSEARQILKTVSVTRCLERRVTLENQLLEASVTSGTTTRKLISTLHSAGFYAVEGPASSAHRSSWERHNAPSWFAEQCCVCFPWSEFDRDMANVVIEIDPRGGFGAGSHPTTLLVLEQLAKAHRLGKVLDVGCGTGVLAIAAALFGADDVTAIDTSQDALTRTRANAINNKVAHIVQTSKQPIERLEGQYEKIVANLHSPALIDMAVTLNRLLKPEGSLILSGLSKGQVSVTAAALAPLVIVEETSSNDWTALVLAPAKQGELLK